MTASVVIRPASVDDAATLAAVGETSFRAAYADWSNADDLEAHLDEAFSERAIRTAFAEGGCWYLLAFVDDAPAGFVKIRANARPDEVPVNSALELQQVYVHPERQRFGVGGRLLAAAWQVAAGEGAEGVWLTVWEDAPWAVNCYRKYGFEQVGTYDFRLGSTIYNDLLMWRPVTG